MRERFIFLILVAFLTLTCDFDQVDQDKIFDITSYGAKGDGTTLNTSKIQSAIDAAANAGGGKVLFPEGVFLSGSIILKSGVELHLDKKAVLLGSTNPDLYEEFKYGQALILADGQKDVSITGRGAIDGQGRQLALNIDSLFYVGKLDSIDYNLQRKRPNKRPKIIEIDYCKNVLISGVVLKNPAMYVQNYEVCENLDINNIHVEADAYWNNDGIDIVDCKNVRVTDCFVNSADDGICLKSESPDHWNDSIYIANCTVRSSASAVKFGTASTGGFKNVKIENIKVYNTFRSAIAIESVDGGTLENIEINNVFAKNTGNAIFIRLGHRNRDGEVGILRNVTIRNVKVEIPFGPPDLKYDIRGPELSFFHNPFPSSITGIPGHNVENVIIENIQISYPGRGNNGYAIIPLWRLKDVPEKERAYPEFSMFGELPAWGFYIRHVDGLTMKNISIKIRENDSRSAFVFDDVHNFLLTHITISKANYNSPIILNNVTGENIQNIKTPGFRGKTIRIIK
ncbi:MAG: glycoside hydrolase family 28 protein [Mangrovibacterium sp.]